MKDEPNTVGAFIVGVIFGIMLSGAIVFVDTVAR